jgi:transcriptional regulator with XRE-family HTH domain
MRLSQTKLGDAIGVTFQQVQKYENGANRIGASNLFRIARALDVDVDVMFFYQDIPESVVTAGRGAGLAEPPPAEFERDPMSSRDSIELMHNYFRIPDSRVRRRLGQLVKSLTRNVD